MVRTSQLAATVVVSLSLSVSLFAAQPVAFRGTYALVLQDKPAVEAVKRGARRDSPEVAALRASIRDKQRPVVDRLEALGFHVRGSMNTLLNAVFVHADPKDIPTLRAIPGVLYVAPMHRAKLMLDQAVKLVDAPNAWNVLGGITAAGAGQKIAIIDTGIDQTHPAFQDSTLTMPAGFPKCDTVANCAYTSNKVIVARSYVTLDANSSDPASSFPDDISPRDRVGHGTAVAMCAGGNTNSGPLAIITGLAPHAYLGNYKIYGTPGITDGSSDQAIMQAFEDAFNDGMDVANLSSGFLPFSGPLDSGSICGNPAGVACDPLVSTIENAILSQNMVIVIAAGNDGQDTANAATLNSIGSPGYTPDAIAVAATANSRIFTNAVHISGPNVPSAVQSVAALTGDSDFLTSVFTSPLIDASKVGDGFGCTAYTANSLSGSIALIERGASSGTSCSFVTKVSNASNAGASGVIVYDNVAGEPLITMSLSGTFIPAFFIGNSDGVAIKSYVDSTSGVQAALDPSYTQPSPAPDANQVVFFSSRGPATGSNALKPDVAAPGEYIYTAAQNFDPNGELYDPSRYILTQGTSFSTPIVAGIAALVREKNPTFTALQVKSAIVNTATSDTTDPSFTKTVNPTFTGTEPASGVTSVGGGKAEAFSAISTNVTVEPPTVSFGALTAGAAVSLPAQALLITNHSAGALTLALAVNRITADSSTQLTLDTASITLQPGQAQTVHLTLSGTGPAANIYQGAVTINGGSVPLHVPYLYMVGTGTVNDVFAVAGEGDIGFVNQTIEQGVGLLKVIDQYGVAVPNVPVTWTPTNGGTITNADATTNSEGFAGASLNLGANPNTSYTFDATLAGGTFTFTDYAFAQPTISTGGVVNAASFTLGQGIAPGSYVAIFGTGFAGETISASYTPFPIAISSSSTTGLSTSVGFDATGVSVPAPLLFISPGQVNIQVPWELSGQTTAQMKVNLEPLNGALFTVPIAKYSPACFTVNGNVAAQDLNYNLISSANPGVRGQYVILYCNGLGPVNNPPASGSPVVGVTSTTTTQPQVTIGGQAASIYFSGLAAGFTGLYQLNVQIPAGISAGTQPLALSIGGVDAPTVNIPVI